MQIFEKPISWIVTGAMALSCVLVVCLVAHVSFDVVMRYAFNQPLGSTTLFVSKYYMVAIAFLPLAFVEGKGNHIAVELLSERFPSKMQTILAVLAALLTAVVAAFVAIRTGQEAFTKYNTGAFSIEGGGKVITWPTYFFLPIGFGLMSLVAAWKTVAILYGKDGILGLLNVDDPYLVEVSET